MAGFDFRAASPMATYRRVKLGSLRGMLAFRSALERAELTAATTGIAGNGNVTGLGAVVLRLANLTRVVQADLSRLFVLALNRLVDFAAVN